MVSAAEEGIARVRHLGQIMLGTGGSFSTFAPAKARDAHDFHNRNLYVVRPKWTF